MSTRLLFCATRILVHNLPRTLRIIFMSWFLILRLILLRGFYFRSRKVAIAGLAIAFGMQFVIQIQEKYDINAPELPRKRYDSIS